MTLNNSGNNRASQSTYSQGPRLHENRHRTASPMLPTKEQHALPGQSLAHPIPKYPGQVPHVESWFWPPASEELRHACVNAWTNMFPKYVFSLNILLLMLTPECSYICRRRSLNRGSRNSERIISRFWIVLFLIIELSLVDCHRLITNTYAVLNFTNL